MLEIEFSDPDIGEPCECCGGQTVALTRSVTEDGDAYAIYYIRFSIKHADRSALATVSIGEWGEDCSPVLRDAFALELHPDGVRVLDAHQSPWNDVELIGRTLDRDQALAHSRIKDVFHITDHIYLEDEEFKGYLTRINADVIH